MIQLLEYYVKKHTEIVALYLFGSVATQKNNPNSDVDIAIIFQKEINGFERINIETELSDILKSNVDLVIFSNASPLLKHQILKYGHLIFENNRDERIRHEVMARFDFMDSQFLCKEIFRIDHYAR